MPAAVSPTEEPSTATLSRRLLKEALYETVEVLGVKSVTIHPTPEADARA
jgi:hypothetical protein